MQRRDFLRLSAGMAIGSISLVDLACGRTESDQTPSISSGSKKLKRIGVQLYTVRTLMKDDFEGTIAKVAQLGYEEVEFAGYYDRKPSDVRKLLDELELAAPATHIGLQELQENLDQIIDASAIIGHKFIVCPWLPEDQRTMDGYKSLAEFLNTAGEACKKAGMRLAYHNHSFEFETIDEQVPYDILLNETDPDLMDMEIDLFWIRHAGKDPLAYFANYPGRFKLCHVKDMKSSGEMTSVGNGVIDFAAIFAKSEQAGLDHFFIEHDQPDDPLDSISKGIRYLENLTFG
ncbi:MAG: sugar phosphate isomerase/epimerase family protein [bacterium]